MKDILFRGKRADNGEWISGRNIIKFADGSVYMMEQGEQVRFINHKTGNVYCMFSNSDSPIFIKIIPETVGQFTGMIDKHGNKIFEGDIVRNEKDMRSQKIYEVRYLEKYARYAFCNSRVVFSVFNTENAEIIGNIHDNGEIF